MNTLETDSVQLSFNGSMVLNNIYLSCRTGEVVGLIGRNGSGKSCLMKVIFGTLRADNQSVRINNTYYSHPYRQYPGIKYLPQEGFLPDYLTALDAARLYSADADKVFGFSELHGCRHERIGNLSGGQKKLVEVLCLLCSPAKFILLDEPFSFLTPVTTEKLTLLIQEESQTKGIILTDHLYRTVMDICDRLSLISQGVLKPVDDIQMLADLGYIPDKGHSVG